MVNRLVMLSCLMSAVAAMAAPRWGLKVKAVTGCIEAPELARAVEAKLERSVFATDADLKIDGIIDGVPGAWKARLTLVSRDGEILGNREVPSGEASCRSLDGKLTAVIALLIEAGAPPAVEPPAALREAVLGAVAALPVAEAATVDRAVLGTFVEHDRFTDPEPEVGESAADEVPPSTRPRSGRPDASERTDETDDSPVTPAPSDPIATVTPLRPRPSASRGSRWGLLVAAAVALFAVIGITVWQPWAPRVITAADVLAASDAVRVTGPVKGGGTLTVVRSQQLGRAVLTTTDVPDAPSGKVRQAWLQAPTGMVPAGLLPSGTNVSLLLDGDARTAVGAGLSVEPAGGAAEPSDVRAVVGL